MGRFIDKFPERFIGLAILLIVLIATPFAFVFWPATIGAIVLGFLGKTGSVHVPWFAVPIACLAVWLALTVIQKFWLRQKVYKAGSDAPLSAPVVGFDLTLWALQPLAVTWAPIHFMLTGSLLATLGFIGVAALVAMVFPIIATPM